MPLPDDPVQRDVILHAITFETASNADVVGIVCGDRDPKPADKRTAAQTLKALVADGWLSGGRGVYRPTDQAIDAAGTIVVASGSARDDPLGRYDGPSSIARVNSIVERIAALQAAGYPVDPELEEQVRLARMVHAANDWRTSMPAMFPSVCEADFAPHHEDTLDWADAIELHQSPRPLCTFWSRGHAKCRDVRDEVLMADGTRRPLGEVGPGDRVMSYDSTTRRTVAATVRAYEYTGEKACIRITTRSGKVATVTPEHRMLTFRGWVEAGALTTDDRIASPRHTRIEPTATVPDWEVALTAYTIAEGGTSDGSLNITNCDRVLRRDIMACALEGGFEPTLASWGGSAPCGLRINKAKPWLKRHPSLLGWSTTKRLPEWVYQLPEDQRWRFLAVMFDTDGYVSQKAGCMAITLANRPLIEDLAYLFASVGVVSSVIERPNDCAGAWQLAIDQECLPLVRERMPLLLKGPALDRLMQRPRYSLMDTYPGSVTRDLPFRMNRRIRSKGVNVAAGPPTRDLTRAKLRRIIDIEPFERWTDLEDADVFWDRVVSIEDAGVVETADIEVEGTENFVGGLLVTHNSSLAEMICIRLGHRRVRRYGLYVCGTQAKADSHVQAIADLLESPEIAAIDPELSQRDVNQYSTSKGWRHNRLITKAGFSIDAVGLDKDIRGARIGTQRPDLIIFDDVDGSADSPATTEKKIQRITKDVMPARDPRGVAIMFVQNIIHGQSVAARLAEVAGAPDPGFLTRRKIIGPIPAVEGLEMKEVMDEEVGRMRTVITAGTPTWPDGFGLDACQDMIDEEGPVAFLSECQHVEGTLSGTMFKDIDWDARTKDIVDMPPLAENGTWRGHCGTWVDPAVTSKDGSDSCAVVTDGWDPVGGFVWRLYAWERIASPEEAILNGLEAAMQWGSQVLGCEVDQGGDTWEVVYRTVVKAQLDDPTSFTSIRLNEDGVPIPRYEQRRATSDGQMSKRQRIATMQARYTTDLFRHLAAGTWGPGADALKAGLKRFPQYKPYDVADAGYHSWRWLMEQVGEPGSERDFKMGNPSKRGAAVGPIAG